MGSAQGRTAVITGGGSGIGLGVAKKCAELRMNVCIADVNSQALSRATNTLIKLGAKSVLVYRCDVSKVLEVWDLKDKVYAEYGEVSFLFNNAGLSAGYSSFNSTKSEWDLALGVNLNGVINGISAFVPSMIAQNTPCYVVNTSSVAGLVGANAMVDTGVPYVVAKTAVTSLTECLAVELRAKKSKLTTHVLMPGMVKTGIIENSQRAQQNHKFASSNSILTGSDEKLALDRFNAKLKSNGLSVEEVVESMYKRLKRGDFYLVITPPDQPEAVFRALSAVRGDDIVHNRPANSITIKPMSKDTRAAFKKNVAAAAKVVSKL
mmetsp:Transcript_9338/g.14961  ORF Transcript_9338/g.14961 Transcript_9338/m.14961 type:complete len:321 (-) Transcript_9338:230-1192(-)